MKNNDIVEYRGEYGRVLYHDTITHTVHVLFRVNNHTWKVEKCDELFCNPAQIYLWPMEYAFCIKYNRQQRTPELVSMNCDVEYFMEI